MKATAYWYCGKGFPQVTNHVMASFQHKLTEPINPFLNLDFSPPGGNKGREKGCFSSCSFPLAIINKWFTVLLEQKFLLSPVARWELLLLKNRAQHMASYVLQSSIQSNKDLCIYVLRTDKTNKRSQSLVVENRQYMKQCVTTITSYQLSSKVVMCTLFTANQTTQLYQLNQICDLLWAIA